MTGGTGQAVSYWITLFGGSDTKADADVVKRFTKALLPQLDVFLGLRKAIREVEQELGEATENRPPNFDTIKPHVTEHAPSWEELRGASDPDLTAFTVKPMVWAYGLLRLREVFKSLRQVAARLVNLSSRPTSPNNTPTTSF